MNDRQVSAIGILRNCDGVVRESFMEMVGF